MTFRIPGRLLPLALLAGLWAAGPAAAEPAVTAAIDEGQRVVLAGNTRPEAATATDLGAVPDSYPMPHLLLQLKRSPEREQALERFLAALYDPASPQFHHWLSPAELGARYGVDPADRAAVARWLRGHGFSVDVEYENGVLIDFSGTAGQVRAAFHTEIHGLDVAGVRHIANMGDPEIPAALAPAVEGVVALHDFRPHNMVKYRPNYTYGGGHAVVPADLATIYNLKAAFAAGLTGKGETVVVIEDTLVYSTADWTTFRKAFGLSGYSSGSFTQENPPAVGKTNNCINPGIDEGGDDGEATLDAEWASAAAPDAAIVLAACANKPDGILIAFQNVIAAKSPPKIVSISYGECEAENGAVSNAAYNAAYQQAATEGVSVFVSAGDENAASCDAGAANATHGIGVSALASSPYVVAVGGTDFADGFNGNGGKYWSAKNSAVYGSAKSYIPEIPWDGSCASVLIAESYSISGSSVPYGKNGYCNNGASLDGTITVSGGSGGPSGCATGAPAVKGVVGGTCKGYAKPSWQSVLGNPADGVRDIPDVSLFASNGVWDEYYVFCFTDPTAGGGGAPCKGAPANWSGAGGTSFSAPILAGIQALVNQKNGTGQGNPNPVYYQLARTEYGSAGSSGCNSDGSSIGSSCVFYDVTLGDMDVNCTGKVDCYLPSGHYGVLSTTDSAYKIAYGTSKGWDFATGIGTVNAYNLIQQWHTGLAATRTAATR